MQGLNTAITFVAGKKENVVLMVLLLNAF